MNKNIISENVNRLGNEFKLNLNPEFRMKVDKIEGNFIRLGVSNWDHHAGGDWVGTGRITQKCDQMGIPYMFGDLGNEYIIISSDDLPKLDIESLQGNFSTACKYPNRYFKTDHLNSGKYLFVSDIHGYNENLANELTKIAKENPPLIVFFVGDIVGTPILDKLQKKFYEVFNKMKILTNPSDTEIISIVGIETQELLDFLCQLSPEYHGISIPQMARTAVFYDHFGHFVSNLIPIVREKLRLDMKTNAQKIIDIMTLFTKAGSKVIVIEGNWDARTPLDFYPSTKCVPIPVDKRSFYLQDFIKSQNKETVYVSDCFSIETEDLIFQTISFDGVINYVSGDFRHPKNIHEPKKPIVLVSHIQAAWEAVKKKTVMTDEGKKASEKMWSIISDLEPQYCVHGHQHDKLLDELGNECEGYSYWKFNYMKTHYLPINTFRFIDF